jgi:predicted Rossmann fold flavoprotein
LGHERPCDIENVGLGARILFDKNYQFTIIINWLNDISANDCEQLLKDLKLENAKKSVSKKSPFQITTRLWEQLVLASGIESETKWADLNKVQIQSLSKQLTESHFSANGKSTFKEEFVTAGGIDLHEINFKTMESKLHKNLYFAGEVMNIDAVTGGFNFQNAWTSGWLVAQNF